jgi:PIN domain nuclease of toxin-antitoxin system
MKRALLDTHAFLWWLMKADALSEHARLIMSEGETDLLLSAASAWEIAIKVQIGKIRLPAPAAAWIPLKMAEADIVGLPVEVGHALRVAELPPHHRDPFDRLLAAQALVEGLPLITDDPHFAPYGVDLIW